MSFTSPQRFLIESEGVIFNKVGDEYQTALFKKMLDPESEEARGYYRHYLRDFKPGYWVSPDGSKLYRADPQGHLTTAATILKNEYGQEFNYYTDQLDDRHDLLSHGWVRVRGNELEANHKENVLSAVMRLLDKGFYKEDTVLKIYVDSQKLQGSVIEIVARLRSV